MEIILFLKALSTVKLEKGWNRFLIFSHAYVDTNGFTEDGKFFKRNGSYERSIEEYEKLIKEKYEDAFKCRHTPKSYLSKVCNENAVTKYFELKDKGYYFILRFMKKHKIKTLEKMEDKNELVS